MIKIIKINYESAFLNITIFFNIILIRKHIKGYFVYKKNNFYTFVWIHKFIGKKLFFSKIIHSFAENFLSIPKWYLKSLETKSIYK